MTSPHSNCKMSKIVPRIQCDYLAAKHAALILSLCRPAYDMNDKQDRPYVCEAPGCSQRFQFEEHLIIHRHKHEMTLRFSSTKPDTTFTDQTPTPTRFLQNCEEVGLFKEIEEEFLQAQEEEESKQTVSHNGPCCMNQHQLKAQLQHPHHQPPLHHPHAHSLQHPQSHGPMIGPSCSLATQQAVSSSLSGSANSQAPSMLTHSGPVPGPPSSLLHIRNRHCQPLPASLPGTLPDPAMQGASAQHMSVQADDGPSLSTPAPSNGPFKQSDGFIDGDHVTAPPSSSTATLPSPPSSFSSSSACCSTTQLPTPMPSHSSTAPREPQQPPSPVKEHASAPIPPRPPPPRVTSCTPIVCTCTGITGSTANAPVPLATLPACTAGRRKLRPSKEDGRAGPRRTPAKVPGTQPSSCHPLQTEEEIVGVVAGEES
ncbi:cyclic AMP-dependent transcription factor ATF-2-like isoform X6 [Phyllopteryx taeniolatus]|uniref:cyclic AMP-dependent transcription factor ATF-2-like isoform X6 n=1 Tax=Phyllopteryx taeniolatus TaxID=161469 RepID=UPI002AD25A6F|nr:cyclic AMP-dependent transcription factor ATF-2-like isoform X6 [Phyllopteryx taeniolatus]